jgi:hypothetical protein
MSPHSPAICRRRCYLRTSEPWGGRWSAPPWVTPLGSAREVRRWPYWQERLPLLLQRRGGEAPSQPSQTGRPLRNFFCLALPSPLINNPLAPFRGCVSGYLPERGRQGPLSTPSQLAPGEDPEGRLTFGSSLSGLTQPSHFLRAASPETSRVVRQGVPGLCATFTFFCIPK